MTIKERHYGLNYPEVTAALTNLGYAYGSLCDTQKKRELQERVLAIEERYFGPEHPEVAVILTNLGYAYGNLGDLN